LALTITKGESNMSQIADTPEQLGVGEQGDWQYPSAAQEGYTEIELPTPPGSINPTERLHMRDFGSHLIEQLDTSMRASYLKAGPQQGPVATFRHYIGCAEGAQLMDEGALKRMKDLANDFAAEPEKQEYFNQVVRPYLLTLVPKRRG
jgi:hypothetical protein